MAITIKKGLSTTPIPVGTYPAAISKIVVLGTQPDPFNSGKSRREVFVEWKLREPTSGVTWTVGRSFTLSFHQKSSLMGLIETLSGDFEGKGLDSMLGLSCQLKIEHTDKGRAKIVSWYPSSAAVELEVEPVYFDFNPVDEDAVSLLADWLQKKIHDSPEWKVYEQSKHDLLALNDSLDHIGGSEITQHPTT